MLYNIILYHIILNYISPFVATSFSPRREPMPCKNQVHVVRRRAELPLIGVSWMGGSDLAGAVASGCPRLRALSARAEERADRTLVESHPRR